MNQIMSKECSCFYFLDYVLSVHTKSNAKLKSQTEDFALCRKQATQLDVLDCLQNLFFLYTLCPLI